MEHNKYQNNRASHSVETPVRRVSVQRKNKRPKIKKENKNKTKINISHEGNNSKDASNHSRLKTNKPSKIQKPHVPKPTSTLPPTQNTDTYVKVTYFQPASGVITQATSSRPKQTVRFATSIPQAKANIAQKQQQRMHRCGGGTNDTTYERMKRIKEVQRQKKVLSDMLDTHHKLQSDRLHLVKEIKSMTNHLHEIHHKLDNALKKLDACAAVSKRVHKSNNISNVHDQDSQRNVIQNHAVRSSVINTEPRSIITKPDTKNRQKRM